MPALIDLIKCSLFSLEPQCRNVGAGRDSEDALLCHDDPSFFAALATCARTRGYDLDFFIDGRRDVLGETDVKRMRINLLRIAGYSTYTALHCLVLAHELVHTFQPEVTSFQWLTWREKFDLEIEAEGAALVLMETYCPSLNFNSSRYYLESALHDLDLARVTDRHLHNIKHYADRIDEYIQHCGYQVHRHAGLEVMDAGRGYLSSSRRATAIP